MDFASIVTIYVLSVSITWIAMRQSASARLVDDGADENLAGSTEDHF